MLEIYDSLSSILQQVFALDPSHTVATLPFIALWPDCSDPCKKCGKDIEGTSFFVFSVKKYCAECRQELSEKESAQGAAYAQDSMNLLREVEQALGHDCDGLTDEEVRKRASKGFLDVVIKRKSELFFNSRERNGDGIQNRNNR
ncbi:MAG: hypothetical protein A3J08_00205 [Candidatus Lloydbacteria bacterium RIFCSPLOWO2_02_FULL_51_11]|uniref:Uncharacterized protein n=1 Tax=Candidatus Lloydbacteria bacterium RIFCSPLOWO2_02_FULL_51_11 TaxID=1798667 RepID=A0A1G2DPX8_9BACT|nr:MAG: hypothetical protein A3J08_00205 [Candidatus Lloydbacteria bacterium RIFCSPLOWO2_02_FULL_51_11]